MRILFAYLTFLLLGFVSGKCVDIDTPEIQNRLNVTYDSDCFKHTKSKYECCSHFLLDDRCIDDYKECIEYKDYVLDGLKHQCDGHSKELFNLTYSDKCHDFTLLLEPYCCDNMTLPECSEWYTECHLHHHGEDHNESNCLVPTKYTNDFCSDYVKHIDDDCCNDFNENCVGIYNWCLDNNPNETSVLDLFLGPRIGHIMGDSHKVYNNIGMLELCASLCVQTHTCQSINYMEDYGQCHLSNHVIGDSGVEFMDNSESIYYSKVYKMPIHDTLCNVRYDHWVGDGMCDTNGGYNTPECHYDGGDCCKETCEGSRYFGCGGFREFECNDPSVLNPTTITTTSVTTTITTTSITSTTRECHHGKVFSTCGSPCEATCLHPNPQCIQVCASGCFCPKDKPIYDIKGSRCVSLGECTTTSTTGTSTTRTNTSTTRTYTSTTRTNTSTTRTNTSTTRTNTSTTRTNTSTTGTETSTGTMRNITTGEPDASASVIKGKGNNNRTRNILLGIFIPILCILAIIGGVILFRKYERYLLIRDGNNVQMDNVREQSSFENPVYNREVGGGLNNELYREIDTETSNYGEVDNNYGKQTVEPELTENVDPYPEENV